MIKLKSKNKEKKEKTSHKRLSIKLGAMVLLFVSVSIILICLCPPDWVEGAGATEAPFTVTLPETKNVSATPENNIDNPTTKADNETSSDLRFRIDAILLTNAQYDTGHLNVEQGGKSVDFKLYPPCGVDFLNQSFDESKAEIICIFYNDADVHCWYGNVQVSGGVC